MNQHAPIPCPSPEAVARKRVGSPACRLNLRWLKTADVNDFLKSRKTTYNREVDAILGARLFKNLAVTRGSFVNVAGPLAKRI